MYFSKDINHFGRLKESAHSATRPCFHSTGFSWFSAKMCSAEGSSVDRAIVIFSSSLTHLFNNVTMVIRCWTQKNIPPKRNLISLRAIHWQPEETVTVGSKRSTGKHLGSWLEFSSDKKDFCPGWNRWPALGNYNGVSSRTISEVSRSTRIPRVLFSWCQRKNKRGESVMDHKNLSFKATRSSPWSWPHARQIWMVRPSESQRPATIGK